MKLNVDKCEAIYLRGMTLLLGMQQWFTSTNLNQILVPNPWKFLTLNSVQSESKENVK